MADYKRVYKSLFNAVTDALEEWHIGDIVEAEYRLKVAQRECEHLFEATEPDIRECEEPNTILIPSAAKQRKGR